MRQLPPPQGPPIQPPQAECTSHLSPETFSLPTVANAPQKPVTCARNLGAPHPSFPAGVRVLLIYLWHVLVYCRCPASEKLPEPPVPSPHHTLRHTAGCSRARWNEDSRDQILPRLSLNSIKHSFWYRAGSIYVGWMHCFANGYYLIINDFSRLYKTLPTDVRFPTNHQCSRLMLFYLWSQSIICSYGLVAICRHLPKPASRQTWPGLENPTWMHQSHLTLCKVKNTTNFCPGPYLYQ